jgi:phosphatidylglycerophosphate synthase
MPWVLFAWSVSRIPLPLWLLSGWTVSRIAFGYWASDFREDGYAILAFTLWWLVILSDMTDGAIARRFNLATHFGGKCLDPFCDYAATCLTGFGLTLGPAAMGWPYPVGFGVALAAAVMKYFKDYSSNPVAREFCDSALPWLYVVTIGAIGVGYAGAISADDTWVYPTTAACICLTLYLKWQRAKDFARGFANLWRMMTQATA